MTTAVVYVAGPVPDLHHPDGGAGGHEPPSGGSTLGERLRRRIEARSPDIGIAADGGLDLALALGRAPQYVIGDMDSVSEGALGVAERSGASVTVVPRAKDASDYELALDEAVRLGASHLVVVGGAGGRLDHLLATVLTLTAERYAGLVIEALLVDNYVAVINGPGARRAVGDAVTNTDPTPARRSGSTAVIDGHPGAAVSLFASNGSAYGVTTTGLAWVLDRGDLVGGTSLGVSNEMIADTATVTVESGCLVVVSASGHTDATGGPLRTDAVGADPGMVAQPDHEMETR